MEGEGVDVVYSHPAQALLLPAQGPGNRLAPLANCEPFRQSGTHCAVRTHAVAVVVEVEDLSVYDERHPGLLGDLAESRGDCGLVDVARAARCRPGVALVHPWGPVLQEDGERAVDVAMGEEQARCAAQAPVAVAEGAGDEAVSGVAPPRDLGGLAHARP